MVLAATALIVLGGITALMGQKVIRFLLPIVGLITGVMVGFGGVQAVFGKGAISLAVAIVMAVIVGVIMGVLSYLFFELALVILVVMLGATAFSYLGVALGLEEEGFVLTLMAIGGGVLGFVWATSTNVTMHLVLGVTSALGVAYVLAGAMLIIGDLSLDQLHESGIIRSVFDELDQSFLWIFAWAGGSLIAWNFQANTAKHEFMDGQWELDS